MKYLLCSLAVALCSITLLHAKEDVPRGFTPISELKDVQAKAAKDKKLIVLVVKGSDDSCPHCAAAMEAADKSVGSGVLQVFARAADMNKADKGGFPEALKNRAKKLFTDGAWVTVLVFNPDMSQIIAEADRKGLDDNKEATAAFHQKVVEAKKALK
ncbi:MAG: hypothetical protein QM755_11195 [Luteolibacter sp.]